MLLISGRQSARNPRRQASSEDRHHQAPQRDRWQEHCGSCQDPRTQRRHHLHVPLHSRLRSRRGLLRPPLVEQLRLTVNRFSTTVPPSTTEQVVLVFPGPGAVTVQDMVQRLHERTDSRSSGPRLKRRKLENVPAHAHATEDPGSGAPDETKSSESRAHPVQKVVFIDSTWNQTNKISTDERLQDLLQVELRTRKTCFWRSQKGKPDTYLATIEAIYYFLKDFHEQCLAQEYSGEYDNLLFFYSYLHTVVNKSKEAGKKEAERREKQRQTEARL
ncbi:tRNA-uridine aminocarboxypropyltransferase 1 isoform X4 [Phycodurus eques]|uniref:tRNA-uridine aminocarboxypropyltransferase 1 isoform X4 n=1 Tax=Phycodurus eques TaxID=693459 RepID=UPI002ACD2009|nr:tRNA-uridine aminocarboxypropyltransferase 1 isoform X4 [Phycodurus eques]